MRVELGSQAERALDKLQRVEHERVLAALAALERDPRPAGKRVKAIEGARDAFLRYGVGHLRIMYEIDDAAGIVRILGIVHRRDLESWLKRQR